VRAPRVLVCGHLTLDRAGGALVPGGSAWYAARALAALGAEPLVLTAAGQEFPAEALAGLEVVVARAPATTTFVNAYDPGGARTQRVLAAAPPLDPAAIPGAWRAPDALLLAPVLGEVDVETFLAAVRAPLAVVGVQGLVRAVAPGGVVRPRPWDVPPAALRQVSAVVIGEDEARGEPGLVARLAADAPLVAFTHGARGCELLSGGRTRRVGVHPAREVDPTGAGDVFAAGLVLGLARGEPAVEAARLGAAAASIVVEGMGGEALGRIGEAWDRVAKVPVEAG
jgi:sugar/nucleoside kinase (ribokinase family)